MRYVRFKIESIQNNDNAMSSILEDQINYIKIKLQAFLIEINYQLEELSKENKNNLFKPNFLVDTASTLIDFMVR